MKSKLWKYAQAMSIVLIVDVLAAFIDWFFWNHTNASQWLQIGPRYFDWGAGNPFWSYLMCMAGLSFPVLMFIGLYRDR